MRKAKILDDLTSDAEELLGKLGDNQSQEVRDLRDRLDRTVIEAKSAVTHARNQASDAIKEYAVSIDDYVHDSPWIALGTAVAAAGVVGFLAGSLLTSNRRTWI